LRCQVLRQKHLGAAGRGKHQAVCARAEGSSQWLPFQRVNSNIGKRGGFHFAHQGGQGSPHQNYAHFFTVRGVNGTADIEVISPGCNRQTGKFIPALIHGACQHSLDVIHGLEERVPPREDIIPHRAAWLLADGQQADPAEIQDFKGFLLGVQCQGQRDGSELFGIAGLNCLRHALAVCHQAQGDQQAILFIDHPVGCLLAGCHQLVQVSLLGGINHHPADQIDDSQCKKDGQHQVRQDDFDAHRDANDRLFGASSAAGFCRFPQLFKRPFNPFRAEGLAKKDPHPQGLRLHFPLQIGMFVGYHKADGGAFQNQANQVLPVLTGKMQIQVNQVGLDLFK